MGGSWRRLEDWEAGQLLVPSQSQHIGLLDDGGNLVDVGYLMMRGPDNHWLIEPVAGDYRYLWGYPAVDGVIPKKLTDNHRRFDPRKDRLEAAAVLLELAHTPAWPNEEDGSNNALGYFHRFMRCTRCRGYSCRRVFITKIEDREDAKDVYYLEIRLSEGLIGLLRPEAGICMC